MKDESDVPSPLMGEGQDGGEEAPSVGLTKEAQINLSGAWLVSPPWRSMILPNVFHGTYSMTCAKSVLPTFMHHLRLFKPESIANVQIEIQIVDTHESLETRIVIGLQAFGHHLNRTPFTQNKVKNRLSHFGGRNQQGQQVLQRLSNYPDSL